jgi:TatD DNase family protein
MLIDTHCHINMMVKKDFDVPLTQEQINDAQKIIDQAAKHNVTRIINVGTSLIESLNCIALAKQYDGVFATVGIHPNDCTELWRTDLKEIEHLLKQKEEKKIVGVGEIGLDRHYPDYNLKRQKDAFRAQIELALKYNVAIVVHTRDARDETLRVLEEYKNELQRGIIHCFSEDQDFADDVIAMKFAIGIGGPVTYPNNDRLRQIAQQTILENIVLETDAPFLPPQEMRGKQNHPQYIELIAHYIAYLRNTSFEHIAQMTTKNAEQIFQLT